MQIDTSTKKVKPVEYETAQNNGVGGRMVINNGQPIPTYHFKSEKISNAKLLYIIEKFLKGYEKAGIVKPESFNVDILDFGEDVEVEYPVYAFMKDVDFVDNPVAAIAEFGTDNFTEGLFKSLMTNAEIYTRHVIFD